MNKYIIAMLMTVFILTGCSNETTMYVAKENTTTSEEIPVIEDESTKEDNQNEIFVYVCGEVECPGVYKLNVDDRICDAIKAAGGPTKEANMIALAQAQKMSDGMTIYVPNIDEKTDSAEMSVQNDSSDGLIDINCASESELMSIPGIGQSKASAIISYRDEHGPFSQIEDLMNITGIKQGVFDKMKAYIKV